MDKDRFVRARYKSDEEYVNTVILSQSERSFTANNIKAIIQRNSDIGTRVIDASISKLLNKGLIVCMDERYYIKSLVRNRRRSGIGRSVFGFKPKKFR